VAHKSSLCCKFGGCAKRVPPNPGQPTFKGHHNGRGKRRGSPGHQMAALRDNIRPVNGAWGCAATSDPKTRTHLGGFSSELALEFIPGRTSLASQSSPYPTVRNGGRANAAGEFTPRRARNPQRTRKARPSEGRNVGPGALAFLCGQRQSGLLVHSEPGQEMWGWTGDRGMQKVKWLSPRGRAGFSPHPQPSPYPPTIFAKALPSRQTWPANSALQVWRSRKARPSERRNVKLCGRCDPAVFSCLLPACFPLRKMLNFNRLVNNLGVAEELRYPEVQVRSASQQQQTGFGRKHG